MIKKIKKSITNFSNDIFPYYSKSSKLNGISSISINSHIYHALVCYHLGNTEIAKTIANKCIDQINIQILEDTNNISQKHSSFYKDLHKTALLTQLICSLENNLKSGQHLIKKTFNKK